MYVVNTPDELLEIALKSLTEDIDLREIKLTDRFNLYIRIRGKSWDGLIDYRIAKAIEKIQYNILSYYNTTFNTKISLKKIPDELDFLIVKAQVLEGSTGLIAYLAKVYKQTIDKMDSKHKLIAFALVCATLGGYASFADYNQRVTATITKIEDENTKREAFKAVQESLKVASESQESLNYLIRKAKEDDMIEFPNYDKQFTKKEAIEEYVNKKFYELETFYIDESYKVSEINIENDQVEIKCKNVKLKASTSLLNDTQKEDLHDKFKHGHLEGNPPIMDLRVTIQMKGPKVVRADIVDIAPPRKDTVSITNVLTPDVIISQKQHINFLPLVELAKDPEELE